MAAVTLCIGAIAAITSNAMVAVERPRRDAAGYLLRSIVTVRRAQLLMSQPEQTTLSFAARPTQRRKTDGGPNICLNQLFVISTSTGAFHYETI